MSSASANTQSALKTQIEFYFSSLNLNNDKYLTSQMDEEKYVPLTLIAGFPKIQKMSGDVASIIEAVKDSAIVELDATQEKIRAKIVKRTTLVLRDLPSTIPEADIRAVIEKCEKAKQIVSIKADIADTWFVQFETEEACYEASLFLPTQTLNGAFIRCGVKATMVVRSVFLNTNTAAWVPGQFNYPKDDKKVRGGSKFQNGTNGKKKIEKANLGPRDFPALGASPTSKTVQTTPVTTTTPTIGYAGEYIKFTREQMAAIVEKMAAYKLPAPEKYAQLSKVSGADNVPTVPILRSVPADSCTLLEPIPVMYPASPSPQMAMAPVSNLPPFLDLSSQPMTTLPTLGAPGTTVIPLTTIPTLNSAMGGLNLAPSVVITEDKRRQQTQQVRRQPQQSQQNWNGNAPRQMKPTNGQSQPRVAPRVAKKPDANAFPVGDFGGNYHSNPVKKSLNFAHIVASTPSAESVEKAQTAAQQIAAAKAKATPVASIADDKKTGEKKKGDSKKGDAKKNEKKGDVKKDQQQQQRKSGSNNKGDAKKEQTQTQQQPKKTEKKSIDVVANSAPIASSAPIDGKTRWADLVNKN